MKIKADRRRGLIFMVLPTIVFIGYIIFFIAMHKNIDFGPNTNSLIAVLIIIGACIYAALFVYGLLMFLKAIKNPPVEEEKSQEE